MGRLKGIGRRWWWRMGLVKCIIRVELYMKACFCMERILSRQDFNALIHTLDLHIFISTILTYNLTT